MKIAHFTPSVTACGGDSSLWEGAFWSLFKFICTLSETKFRAGSFFRFLFSRKKEPGVRGRSPCKGGEIMFKSLIETLEAYQRRDPAARSKLEIFLLYQGVHATLYHRLAHWLYCHKWKFLARVVSQWSRFWTGIEIHPGARIGRRLVIDHGMGIVIGETAEVGDDCLLYHGVTLGGTGKDHGKRHPTIGNNVLISCGAKVLGPFKVGNNARIAANAVVLSEVPDDATAVGIPAQIVRIAGRTTHYADDVDQTSVQNPTLEKLAALASRVEQLEQQMKQQ